LLVWDKDSYIERFLALLPCTCVLQPTLVHLYQTSSLLPILSSPHPIVASDSLRLLYSVLYSEHINHIQVLGFLPFPLGSFKFRITSLENGGVILTYFLFVSLLFLSLVLIALALISSTVLNKSVKSRHPCLVPHFRGNAFNFFLLSIMLAICMLHMIFTMWRYDPSIPRFFRAFIMKGYSILWKAFSASTEKWSCGFRPWLYLHADILCMLNHSYIPGMRPTWFWLF
jgi:hypothetical protein